MTQTQPLRHAAEIVLGRMRNPESEYGANQSPYLRAANVADGRLRMTDVKTMHFSPNEQIRFGLAVGDVLVTEASGSRFQVGQTATWDGAIAGAAFQNTLIRLRPLADTNGRYLYWWSRHAYITGMYAQAAQGLAIWHLSAERMKGLPIPRMTPVAQGRIAAFLDEQIELLDRAIALRQEQMLKLKERFLIQIRETLTGACGPTEETGNSWFPYLPTGWRTIPLKYRWRVVDCKHRTPVYLDSGIPLVSTGDITKGRLDLSRTARFVSLADYADLADPPRRPRRGDIVYSRNASIGLACYVDTDDAFTMGQDVCRITSPAGDQLFLAYVLNYLVEPQIEVGKVGSTFARINVENILQLNIPVPPTEAEQVQIGHAADGLDEDHNHLMGLFQRQEALLEARKRALISAAVLGEFDVTTARKVTV